MAEYLVSDNLLHELAATKRQVEILWERSVKTEPPTIILRRNVGKVSGTITAATDSMGTRTCGTGTVTLYKKNSDDELEAVTDSQGSDVTETVYSWSATASGSDAWVYIEQDSLGTWWFVEEDC